MTKRNVTDTIARIWIYAFALIVLGLLIAGFLNAGLSSPPILDGDSHEFMIAVVGDGVPTKKPIIRAHPLNNAQGLAMWQGANAALEKSPRAAILKSNKVKIVTYDDAGNIEGAVSIAKQIQSDPRILAVIGHATSGTTREAAWYYNEAGIPLLMPIATSPYAAIHAAKGMDNEIKLRNCFRLPPVDDPAQAGAVAYLATEIAKRQVKSKRCYLLRDISADAAEYSQPIYSRLELLLQKIIKAKRQVDREQPNIPAITDSIRGYGVDLVVFCGYGTTAQELLNSLRRTYKDVPMDKRPSIILTDGCKTEDLDPSGFHVYLTFPLPDVFSRNAALEQSSDMEILTEAIKDPKNQSYQMYGYDAVLILAHAFERCSSKEVSRECILREVGNTRGFRGASLMYTFDAGENLSSSYYYYTAHTKVLGSFGQFEFKGAIPHEALGVK